MKDSSKINFDLKLVIQYLKFGKFLGIVPYNSTSSRFAKKCLSKFYVLVLTVLLAAVFVFSVLDREKLYRKMKLIHVVVDFLVLLLNFLLILSCRAIAMVKLNKFRDLDKTILLLENCLTTVNFKINKWNIICLHTKFFLLHCLFFITHVLEAVNTINNDNNMGPLLFFLPHVIGMYHQLFVINIMTKLNHAIELRYNFLRENLEANLTNTLSTVDSLQKNDKVLNLNQIFNISKIIYKLCDVINELYGLPIFFILSRTVLETLKIINLMSTDVGWSELGSDFAYGATFTISTILIVKSCDKVVNSSMNILLVCYTNQETLKGTLLENQLLRLAKLNKHLVPRYSAGGFADINQKLLASLFSATLTYLIVMIQFDLSSKS